MAAYRKLAGMIPGFRLTLGVKPSSQEDVLEILEILGLPHEVRGFKKGKKFGEGLNVVRVMMPAEVFDDLESYLWPGNTIRDDVFILNRQELGLLCRTAKKPSMIVRLPREFSLAALGPNNFGGALGYEKFSIWCGPEDGKGIEGAENRDLREDDLNWVDWDEVLFHRKPRGWMISGEAELLQLKQWGNTLLGGRACLSLWLDYLENREDSVLEKLFARGINRVHFFGLILLGPGGSRYVLYLYRDDKEWHVDYADLSFEWDEARPIACLPNPKG